MQLFLSKPETIHIYVHLCYFTSLFLEVTSPGTSHSIVGLVPVIALADPGGSLSCFVPCILPTPPPASRLASTRRVDFSAARSAVTWLLIGA